MIHITLPDGSKRSYENPMTVIDVAKDISEGLARNVISANFNNVVLQKRNYKCRRRNSRNCR